MSSASVCSLMALAGLRARDVMIRDPVAVAEHESLAAAWEVLARGGCHFLPVLRRDRHGRERVVGVIDDRAIVLARSTKWLDGRPRLAGEAARPAVTVDPDITLGEIIDHLTVGPSALVVVDQSGAPIGLVTAERVLGLLDLALGCAAHEAVSPQP